MRPQRFVTKVNGILSENLLKLNINFTQKQILLHRKFAEIFFIKLKTT